MRTLIAASCALAALAALATTRPSGAAFSAQTQNPANELTTASSFERMRVASGTYTGNATDNRNVATPFAPDLVIVKGNTAQTAVARTSTMSGDTSKPLAARSPTRPT